MSHSAVFSPVPEKYSHEAEIVPPVPDCIIVIVVITVNDTVWNVTQHLQA